MTRRKHEPETIDLKRVNGTSTWIDPSDRNSRGQFKKGFKGGPGRPRGARSKLGESFLRDLEHDWQEHGAAVLARVRRRSPESYLRSLALLLRPTVTRLELGDDQADAFDGLEIHEIEAAVIEQLAQASPDLIRAAAKRLPGPDGSGLGSKPRARGKIR